MKIGPESSAATFQRLVLPLVAPARLSDVPPQTLTKPMRGRKLPMLTPTWALDETTFCSAWRMSGRRSRRAEGSPGGRLGNFWSTKLIPRLIAPGGCPNRVESRFSAEAISIEMAGINAVAWALAAAARVTSSLEATPPSNFRVKRSRVSVKASTASWAISCAASSSRSAK